MAGFKVVCVLLCVLAVQGSPFPNPTPDAEPSAKSNPSPSPSPSPSGPNALPVSDPKPKASPDPKPDAKPTPDPKPSADPKAKPSPLPDPSPKPKSTANADPEANPDAESAAQQSSGPTERRFGLRRNKDDDENDEDNLRQLPFFQSVRPRPTLRGAGETGLRSPGTLDSLTEEDMLERFPHLQNDPKMLRPIPLSSDGRLLIGASGDGRRTSGLEVPVGTGIVVGPGQSRIPSTPFGNSFRGPFDNSGGRPFDDPFNRPFGTSAGFPQSPFSPGQSFFPQTGTPTLSFPGQRDPQSFSPDFGNSPSLFLNPSNTNSFIPTTQRPFTPSIFSDPRDRGTPRPTTPSSFSPFPTTSPPLFFNPSDGNTFRGSTTPQSFSPGPTSPPLFSNPTGGNTFSGTFPQSFSPNDDGSPLFLNPANTNQFSPRNPPSFFANPQDTNSLDPLDSNPFFLNPLDVNNIPQNELPLLFRDPANRNSFFPGNSPSLFFNPTDFPQGFSSSRPDFSSPTTPTRFSPRPTTPNSLVPRPLPPPSLNFNPGSFSPQPGSPRPTFSTNFSPTTPAPFFPDSNLTPRPTTVSPGDFSFFPSSTPHPGINPSFPSNPIFPSTSSGGTPFFGSDGVPGSQFPGNSGLIPSSSRPRFPILPTNTGRPGQGLFPQQPNFRYAPGYAYRYSVRDPLSGNYQGKEEIKGPDGVVRGSYHLLQPDGKTRVVTYTADDINGFQADVRYLPPPAYH